MLHPAANSHPAPHINGFLWPLLQPTGTPGPHINGFLWASKSAVCQLSCSQQAPQGHTSMASYGHPSLPFARILQPTATPRHTSMASCGHSCSQQAPQGHTSMASYGHPSLPFARPKTLQTLQTLQTLKTLQTLQNRKTRKTLASRASSCSQQLPRATHQWLLMAILAANRHPRATHQWLLMGIQVCRLPALLQPTGTPGPHLNGFLWASKSAVCPP